MRFLALVLTLLAPGAAVAAPREAGATVDVFRERVVEVARTAADPAASPAAVWEKGQAFFGSIPATRIQVQANLRGWDFGVDALGDGREVTAQELSAYGREKLSDLNVGPVPVPDTLRDSVNGLTRLDAAGMVKTRYDMGESLMGALIHDERNPSAARIDTNARLLAIAAVIGKAFGFATMAHEARHLFEFLLGRLSSRAVVAGEIPAFRSQYDWLVLVDPHGERLPYARLYVDNLARRYPHVETYRDARRFLLHLAEVRATNGEERAIRELIERLGYREGEQHHPGDGHAHDDGPTRS
jgi:hypothetical protein